MWLFEERMVLHATLTSVLFVLAMKCNLLSIGQLVQRGFNTVMGGYDKVELYDINKNLILDARSPRTEHSRLIWK